MKQGIPIFESEVMDRIQEQQLVERPEARRPSDITFVRSRIFYAKPALSAAGVFQPGFKHIRASSPPFKICADLYRCSQSVSASR